jgi:hypothetical protein
MLTGKRYWLLLGVAIICMGAICKTSQRDQVMLKVVSHKDDARLEVRGNGTAVIIEIFSASGIGQADFELVSPEMPKRLIMQFHLRGLEELRFAYGETLVSASIASTGEHGIRQNMSRAGERSVEALTSNSPFWMKLRVASRDPIPLREGYIEVEAPEDFLKSTMRKASIHWIDFYR